MSTETNLLPICVSDVEARISTRGRKHGFFGHEIAAFKDIAYRLITEGKQNLSEITATVLDRMDAHKATGYELQKIEETAAPTPEAEEQGFAAPNGVHGRVLFLSRRNANFPELAKVWTLHRAVAEIRKSYVLYTGYCPSVAFHYPAWPDASIVLLLLSTSVNAPLFTSDVGRLWFEKM